MSDKTAPLGICDHCGGPIADPFTSKRKPRRYCSVDCKNTANSRAGNEERTRKLRERIERGAWVNPRAINPPNPANIGAGVRRLRLAEVEAGSWRNPGLSDAARAKNSEAHKHSGPLAEAIERLKHGKMADLSPEQADAYRAYTRENQRRLRANMTSAQKEVRRQQWRDFARRKYGYQPRLTPKPTPTPTRSDL